MYHIIVVSKRNQCWWSLQCMSTVLTTRGVVESEMLVYRAGCWESHLLKEEVPYSDIYFCRQTAKIWTALMLHPQCTIRSCLSFLLSPSFLRLILVCRQNVVVLDCNFCFWTSEPTKHQKLPLKSFVVIGSELQFRTENKENTADIFFSYNTYNKLHMRIYVYALAQRQQQLAPICVKCKPTTIPFGNF